MMEQFYGPEGLVKQLTKALVERMIQAELTEELGYEKSDAGEKQTTNRRNGKTTKTLRTDYGNMEIAVPRDREGEYEPKVIPKHQREWRGFDDKILSMYGLGLSTNKDRKAVTADLKEIYPGVYTQPPLTLPLKPLWTGSPKNGTGNILPFPNPGAAVGARLFLF